MLDWLVDLLFSASFSILGVNISLGNITESVKNVLMISPQSFSTDLWSIMVNINKSIMPICTSILVVLFFTELIQRSTELERVSWEYVVAAFIKYGVSLAIFKSGMYIMNYILEKSGEILNIVVSTVNTNGVDTVSLAESLKELGTKNVINNTIYCVLIIVFWFIYIGIETGVLTVAFAKTIKLLIFTAIAPLPLCTFPNSSTSQTGKRFLTTYISTALESVGIMLACVVYTVMINSVSNTAQGVSTFLALIVVNAVFLYIITAVTQSFKEIAGG